MMDERAIGAGHVYVSQTSLKLYPRMNFEEVNTIELPIVYLVVVNIIDNETNTL